MTSPVSGRPLPSSFDENDDFYNESGLQKVLRRMKREPLIPLGCLLTVAAFTNAYRAMRRGDHNQVQRMFRARVLAQGFTIAAMVAGGLYFGAERHKERELWRLQEEERAEEKRQRWIRELEARDEEEKELQAALGRRRERKRERDGRKAAERDGNGEREAARESFRAAQRKVEGGEAGAKTEAEGGEEKKEGGGAGGSWLGGWLGGPTKKPEAEDQRAEEPKEPKESDSK